jgi:uncharacterized membrane protein
MASLIAVAYENVGTARNVLGELTELSVEGAITLDDAVIVERRLDGTTRLHQTMKLGAVGATGGALWGGLIGMLLLAPFLGAAVGAAAGGALGALADVGVDDSFMRQLAEDLHSGSAAVIVLVRGSTPDKVVPRISRYGGRVLHTSLSADADDQLRSALAATARQPLK